MILPIGHEQTGLRRLPWITFGIMMVCLLAFVLTGFGAPEDPEGDLQAREATRYFMEHPYLEIDERLESRLFPGMSDQKRATLLEGLKMAARPPSSSEELVSEQKELDSLSRTLFEAEAQHPFVRWGLVPAHPSLVGLVTHMFLHAGWLHLIGNLFILYLSGPYIEDVWGRPLFAGFYIVSGLAASLAFMLRYPDLDSPLVGASGAISGVMGAFLVRYWNTKIRFFYWLGLAIRGTFDAPSWLMLPIWFVTQIFFAAMFDSGAGGGVAYLAHAAGFAFGAGSALVIRRLDIEERYIQGTIEAKVLTTHVSKPLLDQALAVKASGNAPGAFDVRWRRRRGRRTTATWRSRCGTLRSTSNAPCRSRRSWGASFARSFERGSGIWRRSTGWSSRDTTPASSSKRRSRSG